MKSGKILLVLLVVFTSATLFAQTPPPQGNGTGAPIDGGALFLLLSAAAYGYSRLKGKEKEGVKA